ncbi:MAG: hypothetical protein E7273_08930 [Pseudobutyrivibrio ruminis]|nr:hypothetical protein [Pseudobutyrivibrio ruminis]
MKNKICMYLPPFAGDYSGVASALFDLGGMLCIHDAAGCTGNYTHFDEPRWYGSEAMVYCTGLRKMEAILGDDEKFIKRIIDNALEKKPEFIAIIGSPVPNVIGFDFKGVANAIEKRTGIPTFGFATAGIKGSYKDGIVMAAKALFEYYDSHDQKEEVLKYTAFPGISPLDMPQDIYENIQRQAEANGAELIQEKGMYGSLDFYKNPRSIKQNVVLNQAGYEIAKYMQEKYGTPFTIGFSIGENQPEINAINESSVKGLLIADGVIGLSIKKYLNSLGLNVNIGVISGRFDGAIDLTNEDKIMDEITAGYDFIIADPLILELAPEGVDKISLPHYAVSSRVKKAENWNYLDTENWRKRLGDYVNLANEKLA